MGLDVQDNEGYTRYRGAMAPILTRYGGRFRYDFRIAEVLATEASHPINRVFVLSFPDVGTREAFFRDPEYLAVRHTYYEPAVGNATPIAGYETA